MSSGQHPLSRPRGTPSSDGPGQRAVCRATLRPTASPGGGFTYLRLTSEETTRRPGELLPSIHDPWASLWVTQPILCPTGAGGRGWRWLGGVQ